MAGHGHAAPLIAAFERVLMRTEWDYRGDPDCGNPGFAWALYRPEDYAPWLREAGLTPVRVERVSRQARFERFDALAAWLRTSWHAYTARVPEGRRDPLIAAVVEAYASGFPEAVGKDGSIHVPCVGLDVEAFRPPMG
jgi:hypothetical protein